jgi:hypothetical protein
MGKESCLMKDIDLEYQSFKCGKTNRNVIVTFLTMVDSHPRSATSSPPVRDAFDCSFKAECGVYQEQGDQKSYNWRGCIHPDLSKQVPSPQPSNNPYPSVFSAAE